MQEMLDTVYTYAGDHRFQIHPVKSNTIIKNITKQKSENFHNNLDSLKLGQNDIDINSETTHLGLKRTTSDDSKINVDERITLARRTLYSLIKSGVHGTNGLNPRTSVKIYQIYVIPRLLYGLETIHIQNKDMVSLCSFHLSTLKHLQSLPNRTATSAVYLLVGALPIAAEIHKRQLSLLHSIAMSDNMSIKEIARRQHISGKPTSFFVKIQDVLTMYQLPSFSEIMNGHFNKLDWKKIVRTSINSYWTSKLREDCNLKTTLDKLAFDIMEIGKTHNIWDTITNSVKQVKQAVTKARMATGTYTLQIHKVKFNQSELDPTCPICRLEDETLLHPSQSCEIKSGLDPNIESSSQVQTASSKVCVRVKASKRDISNFNDESTTTAASLTGFTKEEINFTKMGMIALNILADVLYDLLKPDKPHLRLRCGCDITYLYSEHRKLNKHVPSNSNHRQCPPGPWGGCWIDIQNTDIAIGDDIERIRLTRNELQHSDIFQLNDTRFNELCNILSELLKRFDHYNKPTRLYTDQLNEILAKTVSAEEVKSIENEISGIDFQVEIEHQINVPTQ